MWAIEGATGTGALLAQQLVAAGEDVLDVPPKLSARVRLLDSGRSDKTDSHDARSAAVVALRHASLRPVRAEDHVAVSAAAGQAPPRRWSLPGPGRCAGCTPRCVTWPRAHFPKRMTAAQAAAILARIRPSDPVAVERKALARDLLAEIRRLDRDLAALGARITTSVAASGTTVTDVFGVGPVVAAYLIGHSGDIARFPTAGHYARYNGTAPIQASSGPTKRHRLNPRGNRQLNHALHIAAVTQVRTRHPRPGLLPPQAGRGEVEEGRDAARSNAASPTPSYRQLLGDSHR